MSSLRIVQFLPSFGKRKSPPPLAQNFPTELLAEIFRYFVQDTGAPLGYYVPSYGHPDTRLFGPWILRAVCRSWKGIVDYTAALWAYIVIRDPNCNSALHCLREMAKRSGSNGLLIHTLIITERFALELVEHRARWREIHFVIEEQLFCSHSPPLFGHSVFPMLQVFTLISCPLRTYQSGKELKEPHFIDATGDLAKTLDLSSCPSLTHTAIGVSLSVTLRLVLPNHQITHLELDDNDLPLITFRPDSTVTWIWKEQILPNLSWLHVIGSGAGALDWLNAPNLRHLIVSQQMGVVSVDMDIDSIGRMWNRSRCQIQTLEFRVPCQGGWLAHDGVMQILRRMGPELRELRFSVAGMHSLLPLNWSNLGDLLKKVRCLRIKVKAEVAADGLLPDRYLPPDSLHKNWSDRGKGIGRDDWSRFVAWNAQLLDMARSLPCLDALVLDWDTSVYRDWYYSPTVQRSLSDFGSVLLLREEEE
ncbi:hypothetical protein V5O48_017048 [Marasmius crinis-equi]|uniref:F-box domain-containing protein n=1 Tax=Marasmius crinis-equi TaxID=585013 RepID=A0ABR3EQ18_9AGAR